MFVSTSLTPPSKPSMNQQEQVLTPRFFVSILAQNGSETPVRMVLQNRLMSREGLSEELALVEKKVMELENEISEASILQPDTLTSTSMQRQRGTDLGNSTSDTTALLQNCLFAVERMPDHACPVVVLLTDGVLTAPDTASYENILTHYIRRDVTFNTILLTSAAFHPHSSFGFVPDPGMLEHITKYTGGVLYDHDMMEASAGKCHSRKDSQQTSNAMQVDVLTRISPLSKRRSLAIAEAVRANGSVESGRDILLQSLCVRREPFIVPPKKARRAAVRDYAYPFVGAPPPVPLLREKYHGYSLAADMELILQARVMEGFRDAVIAKSSDRSSIALTISLFLEWQPDCYLEYSVTAPCKQTGNDRKRTSSSSSLLETGGFTFIPQATSQVTLYILCSPELSHVIQDTLRSGTSKNGKRKGKLPAGSAVAIKLLDFLKRIPETDKLLWQFSFVQVPLAATANGVKMTSEVSEVCSPSFPMWQMIAALPVSSWWTWMIVESIDVLCRIGLAANTIHPYRQSQRSHHHRSNGDHSSSQRTPTSGPLPTPSSVSNNTPLSPSTVPSNQQQVSVSAHHDKNFAVSALLSSMSSFSHLVLKEGKLYLKFLTPSPTPAANSSSSASARKLDGDGSEKERKTDGDSSEGETESVPIPTHTSSFCLVYISHESRWLFSLKVGFHNCTSEMRQKTISDLKACIAGKGIPRYVLSSSSTSSNNNNTSSSSLGQAHGPPNSFLSPQIHPVSVDGSDSGGSNILTSPDSQNTIFPFGFPSVGLSSILARPLVSQPDRRFMGPTTNLAAASSQMSLTASDGSLRPFGLSQPLRNVSLRRFLKCHRWNWRIKNPLSLSSCVHLLRHARFSEGFLLVSADQRSYTFAREMPLYQSVPHSQLEDSSSNPLSGGDVCSIQYSISQTASHIKTELCVELKAGSPIKDFESVFASLLARLSSDMTGMATDDTHEAATSSSSTSTSTARSTEPEKEKEEGTIDSCDSVPTTPPAPTCLADLLKAAARLPVPNPLDMEEPVIHGDSNDVLAADGNVSLASFRDVNNSRQAQQQHLQQQDPALAGANSSSAARRQPSISSLISSGTTEDNGVVKDSEDTVFLKEYEEANCDSSVLWLALRTWFEFTDMHILSATLSFDLLRDVHIHQCEGQNMAADPVVVPLSGRSRSDSASSFTGFMNGGGGASGSNGCLDPTSENSSAGSPAVTPRKAVLVEERPQFVKMVNSASSSSLQSLRDRSLDPDVYSSVHDSRPSRPSSGGGSGGGGAQQEASNFILESTNDSNTVVVPFNIGALLDFAPAAPLTLPVPHVIGGSVEDQVASENKCYDMTVEALRRLSDLEVVPDRCFATVVGEKDLVFTVLPPKSDMSVRRSYRTDGAAMNAADNLEKDSDNAIAYLNALMFSLKQVWVEQGQCTVNGRGADGTLAGHAMFSAPKPVNEETAEDGGGSEHHRKTSKPDVVERQGQGIVLALLQISRDDICAPRDNAVSTRPMYGEVSSRIGFNPFLLFKQQRGSLLRESPAVYEIYVALLESMFSQQPLAEDTKEFGPAAAAGTHMFARGSLRHGPRPPPHMSLNVGSEPSPMRLPMMSPMAELPPPVQANEGRVRSLLPDRASGGKPVTKVTVSGASYPDAEHTVVSSTAAGVRPHRGVSLPSPLSDVCAPFYENVIHAHERNFVRCVFANAVAGRSVSASDLSWSLQSCCEVRSSVDVSLLHEFIETRLELKPETDKFRVQKGLLSSLAQHLTRIPGTDYHILTPKPSAEEKKKSEQMEREKENRKESEKEKEIDREKERETKSRKKSKDDNDNVTKGEKTLEKKGTEKKVTEKKSAGKKVTEKKERRRKKEREKEEKEKEEAKKTGEEAATNGTHITDPPQDPEWMSSDFLSSLSLLEYPLFVRIEQVSSTDERSLDAVERKVITVPPHMSKPKIYLQASTTLSSSVPGSSPASPLPHAASSLSSSVTSLSGAVNSFVATPTNAVSDKSSSGGSSPRGVSTMNPSSPLPATSPPVESVFDSLAARRVSSDDGALVLMSEDGGCCGMLEGPFEGHTRIHIVSFSLPRYVEAESVRLLRVHKSSVMNVVASPNRNHHYTKRPLSTLSPAAGMSPGDGSPTNSVDGSSVKYDIPRSQSLSSFAMYQEPLSPVSTSSRPPMHPPLLNMGGLSAHHGYSSAAGSGAPSPHGNTAIATETVSTPRASHSSNAMTVSRFVGANDLTHSLVFPPSSTLSMALGEKSNHVGHLQLLPCLRTAVDSTLRNLYEAVSEQLLLEAISFPPENLGSGLLFHLKERLGGLSPSMCERWKVRLPFIPSERKEARASFPRVLTDGYFMDVISAASLSPLPSGDLSAFAPVVNAMLNASSSPHLLKDKVFVLKNLSARIVSEATSPFGSENEQGRSYNKNESLPYWNPLQMSPMIADSSTDVTDLTDEVSATFGKDRRAVAQQDDVQLVEVRASGVYDRGQLYSSLFCVFTLSPEGGALSVELFSSGLPSTEVASIRSGINNAVIKIVHRVNQMCLLRSLNETRTCSPFLVSAEKGMDPTSIVDEVEDELNRMGDDDSDDGDATLKQKQTSPTAAVTFRPGQFECPLIRTLVLPLHERVRPDIALRALRTQALDPFLVMNRRNMFVFQQKNGSVFYIRVVSSDGVEGPETTASSPRDREDNVSELSFDSRSQSSNAIGPSPMRKASLSYSRASRRRSNSITSITDSGIDPLTDGGGVDPSSTGVAGSVGGGGVGQDGRALSVFLEVFGVDRPGPEITQHLFSRLKAKLVSMTLSKISQIITRNPLFRLTPSDHHFLRPPNATPTATVCLALPPDVKDPYRFLLFLKQNMTQLQFLSQLRLAPKSASHGALSFGTKHRGRKSMAAPVAGLVSETDDNNEDEGVDSKEKNEVAIAAGGRDGEADGKEKSNEKQVEEKNRTEKESVDENQARVDSTDFCFVYNNYSHIQQNFVDIGKGMAVMCCSVISPQGEGPLSTVPTSIFSDDPDSAYVEELANEPDDLGPATVESRALRGVRGGRFYPNTENSIRTVSPAAGAPSSLSDPRRKGVSHREQEAGEDGDVEDDEGECFSPSDASSDDDDEEERRADNGAGGRSFDSNAKGSDGTSSGNGSRWSILVEVWGIGTLSMDNFLDRIKLSADQTVSEYRLERLIVKSRSFLLQNPKELEAKEEDEAALYERYSRDCLQKCKDSLDESIGGQNASPAMHRIRFALPMKRWAMDTVLHDTGAIITSLNSALSVFGFSARTCRRHFTVRGDDASRRKPRKRSVRTLKVKHDKGEVTTVTHECRHEFGPLPSSSPVSTKGKGSVIIHGDEPVEAVSEPVDEVKDMSSSGLSGSDEVATHHPFGPLWDSFYLVGGMGTRDRPSSSTAPRRPSVSSPVATSSRKSLTAPDEKKSKKKRKEVEDEEEDDDDDEDDTSMAYRLGEVSKESCIMYNHLAVKKHKKRFRSSDKLLAVDGSNRRPEKTRLVRQCAIACSFSVQSQELVIWTYNWHLSLVHQLCLGMSRLLSWAAARGSLHDNILHQKLGLFHHISSQSPAPSEFSRTQFQASHLSPSFALRGDHRRLPSTMQYTNPHANIDENAVDGSVMRGSVAAGSEVAHSSHDGHSKKMASSRANHSSSRRSVSSAAGSGVSSPSTGHGPPSSSSRHNTSEKLSGSHLPAGDRPGSEAVQRPEASSSSRQVAVRRGMSMTDHQRRIRALMAGRRGPMAGFPMPPPHLSNSRGPNLPPPNLSRPDRGRPSGLSIDTNKSGRPSGGSGPNSSVSSSTSSSGFSLGSGASSNSSGRPVSSSSHHGGSGVPPALTGPGSAMNNKKKNKKGDLPTSVYEDQTGVRYRFGALHELARFQSPPTFMRGVMIANDHLSSHSHAASPSGASSVTSSGSAVGSLTQSFALNTGSTASRSFDLFDMFPHIVAALDISSLGRDFSSVLRGIRVSSTMIRECFNEAISDPLYRDVSLLCGLVEREVARLKKEQERRDLMKGWRSLVSSSAASSSSSSTSSGSFEKKGVSSNLDGIASVAFPVCELKCPLLLSPGAGPLAQQRTFQSLLSFHMEYSQYVAMLGARVLASPTSMRDVITSRTSEEKKQKETDGIDSKVNALELASAPTTWVSQNVEGVDLLLKVSTSPSHVNVSVFVVEEAAVVGSSTAPHLSEKRQQQQVQAIKAFILGLHLRSFAYDFHLRWVVSQLRSGRVSSETSVSNSSSTAGGKSSAGDKQMSKSDSDDVALHGLLSLHTRTRTAGPFHCRNHLFRFNLSYSMDGELCESGFRAPDSPSHESLRDVSSSTPAVPSMLMMSVDSQSPLDPALVAEYQKRQQRLFFEYVSRNASKYGLRSVVGKDRHMLFLLSRSGAVYEEHIQRQEGIVPSSKADDLEPSFIYAVFIFLKEDTTDVEVALSERDEESGCGEPTVGDPNSSATGSTGSDVAKSGVGSTPSDLWVRLPSKNDAAGPASIKPHDALVVSASDASRLENVQRLIGRVVDAGPEAIGDGLALDEGPHEHTTDLRMDAFVVRIDEESPFPYSAPHASPPQFTGSTVCSSVVNANKAMSGSVQRSTSFESRNDSTVSIWESEMEFIQDTVVDEVRRLLEFKLAHAYTHWKRDLVWEKLVAPLPVKEYHQGEEFTRFYTTLTSEEFDWLDTATATRPLEVYDERLGLLSHMCDVSCAGPSPLLSPLVASKPLWELLLLHLLQVFSVNCRMHRSGVMFHLLIVCPHDPNFVLYVRVPDNRLQRDPSTVNVADVECFARFRVFQTLTDAHRHFISKFVSSVLHFLWVSMCP